MNLEDALARAIHRDRCDMGDKEYEGCTDALGRGCDDLAPKWADAVRANLARSLDAVEGMATWPPSDKSDERAAELTYDDGYRDGWDDGRLVGHYWEWGQQHARARPCGHPEQTPGCGGCDPSAIDYEFGGDA